MIMVYAVISVEYDHRQRYENYRGLYRSIEDVKADFEDDNLRVSEFPCTNDKIDHIWVIPEALLGLIQDPDSAFRWSDQ